MLDSLETAEVCAEIAGMVRTLSLLGQDVALLTRLRDQARREWPHAGRARRAHLVRRIWAIKEVVHLRRRTIVSYARMHGDNRAWDARNQRA